jgi:hypothetical protein
MNADFPANAPSGSTRHHSTVRKLPWKAKQPPWKAKQAPGVINLLKDDQPLWKVNQAQGRWISRQEGE